jgi:hypothetical protein
MDITPQGDSQQSISDDQELAKALAGVLPPIEPPSALPQPTTFVSASSDVTPASTSTSDLESIKKDALIQLRPLIGKVDLPPEEKFNTYLMLIRSTDDSSLVGPAHVAAQSITDETRRAEALLDIIKEIDYLSRNNQQPAA